MCALLPFPLLTDNHMDRQCAGDLICQAELLGKKILQTEKLVEALHAVGCQKKTGDLTAGSWKSLSWQPAHDSGLTVICSLNMEIQPSCSTKLEVINGGSVIFASNACTLYFTLICCLLAIAISINRRLPRINKYIYKYVWMVIKFRRLEGAAVYIHTE